MLRGGLLAGAGVATAGATSAVLTGTAKASVSPGYQPGWAFCINCHAMFWTGDGNYGQCPKAPAGSHSHAAQAGNFDYYFSHNYPGLSNSSEPQPGWRFCNWCYTLFWGPAFQQACWGDANGRGPHNNNFSYDYDVPWGLNGAQVTNPQGNWRWCSWCAELYYQGPSGSTGGVCPFGLAAHVAGSARSYDVYHSGVIPA